MPGRTHLTGVFRYADKRGWDIHILQNASELTPEIVRNAETENTDGFIIGIRPDNDAVVQMVANSPIPVVSIGIPDYCRRPDSVLVRNDDRAIGMIGAQHLLSLGNFNSFGFVPDLRKRMWSADRLAGFTEHLSKYRRVVHVYDSPLQDATAVRTADRAALVRWLKDLPKPASVMVAWDTRAIDVMNACRAARLKIPEQIAVLGVDDDELLCENASPPLSSIKPNCGEVGFRAAEALEKLMNGKHSASVMFCDPISVTERESTKSISPAVHLVNRARAFIKANACKGARISDVVEHLGVSRRLADLRFREVQGCSMGMALEEERLSEVKRLLTSTTRSIRRIAAACGYTNPNRLSHVFTQRFDMSMSAWRKSNGCF
ncbi:MAG: substrate-binding domain-containing protein [Kiritimatiellae bacterium]|nr:substrate-binding domain-containing protein [Kiritimatiellia bacterium]